MDVIAGLICDNAEIFGIENGLNFVIVGGQCYPLEKSPEIISKAIDISIDPIDGQCLDKMGIKDPTDRRNQWVTCNSSAIDTIPDYVKGKVIKREFTSCSKRGICEFEGKLCRTQSQLTGLTPTEVKIMGGIYNGLLDKEIAQKLGIKPETVKTHTQNIRIKTGCARKADLVRVAQKLNLTQNV